MTTQARPVDHDRHRGRRFAYGSFAVEAGGASVNLTCRYQLDHLRFTERFSIVLPQGAPEPDAAALRDAARLVHLLAGVSYYKTCVPPLVDLGDLEVTDAERQLLQAFYLEGLAEMAYRNQLDLTGTRFQGGCTVLGGARPGRPATEDPGWPHRPLIPFGGGIDSIVTVEDLRSCSPQATLLVVAPAGAPLQAIEASLAVTDLPVLRVERQLDPQVLRSAERGFWNGHVPVTGIISAVATLAAVAGGHDAVVMSNERSASVPTLHHQGRPVNHQWSKGAQFQELFSAAVGSRGLPAYGSHLRDRSELWVAERFATLRRYHHVFRSCNRAFHIQPGARAASWCGRCDKCCFIDLVLAPFLSCAELAEIFGGREPLGDLTLAEQFRVLLGTSRHPRPFECVGDVDECRAAARAAGARPDRRGQPLLTALLTELGRLPSPQGSPGSLGPTDHAPTSPDRLA